MSESEAFQYIATVAVVCAGFALWRWRPTRVLITAAIMALWGLVAIIAPLYFTIQRLSEGRIVVAAGTFVAGMALAVPYIAFAWPAFVKFLRREVFGRPDW